MKDFLIPLLFLIAADIADVGVVTQNEGIEFHHCHEGDRAMIEVVHFSPKTNYIHGFFETDKPALFLSDMSMIPTGTNIFRVRTVCSGSTSEVSEVGFVIRRRIPRPIFAKAERFPMMPPMPQGFIALVEAAIPKPLPGGTNKVWEPARFQGTNVFKISPRRRTQ